VTQESIRLNPDAAILYGNLMYQYLTLNRLDDAKTAYHQAQARKLDHPLLHSNLYGVAFLQGDAAEMKSQLNWAVGTPVEDGLLSFQSDTEAFFGRLERANGFSERAAASAQRSGQKETAADWQINAALREAEFGYADRAKRRTAAALGLSPGRDVKILAALAYARAGDSTQALKLADELQKQSPTNTLLIYYWLPTIRASVEINLGNAAQAIELLQTAAPYELGIPNPEFEVSSTLYPVYVRGEAYLLARKGSEAAGEFQKLLDNRSVTVNSPLGALAHLGLARAYALQGDTAKARGAYQDFLTLWKDADPDIPVLQQAKAEYAKLK
jgi:tetratricopeptide (TPR) repeat protein